MKCIFDILTSLKANTTTSLTFKLGVKRNTSYMYLGKIILYRNVRSSTTSLSFAWKILSFVSDSYKDKGIFEL